VSGVIASNFNGFGTIGVAYESTIVSIRADVSDCDEPEDDVCFESSDLAPPPAPPNPHDRPTPPSPMTSPS